MSPETTACLFRAHHESDSLRIREASAMNHPYRALQGMTGAGLGLSAYWNFILGAMTRDDNLGMPVD